MENKTDNEIAHEVAARIAAISGCYRRPKRTTRILENYDPFTEQQNNDRRLLSLIRLSGYAFGRAVLGLCQFRTRKNQAQQSERNRASRATGDNEPRQPRNANRTAAQRTTRAGKAAASFLICLAFFAQSDARAELDIEPFITYTHLSDILTGNPLNFTGGVTGYEPTTDYIGFGATFAWERVELDLSHGRKFRDCNWLTTSEGPQTRGCPGSSGTMLTVRWYPWRNR